MQIYLTMMSKGLHMQSTSTRWYLIILPSPEHNSRSQQINQLFKSYLLFSPIQIYNLLPISAAKYFFIFLQRRSKEIYWGGKLVWNKWHSWYNIAGHRIPSTYRFALLLPPLDGAGRWTSWQRKNVTQLIN